MKRALVGLSALLVLSGCSTLLGTANWDAVTITFDAAGSSQDYSVTLTSSKVSGTVAGQPVAEELPQGSWTAITAGVRGLGGREAEACADGQRITVVALSGTAVQQSFAATSCDAGDVFDQAVALAETALATLKEK